MAELISNGTYLLEGTRADIPHDSSLTGQGTVASPLGVAVEGPVTSELITPAVSGTTFVYNACIFAGGMVVLSILFNPMAKQTIGTSERVKIGQLTDSRYYPAYTLAVPFIAADINIYGTITIESDGAIYMRATNTSSGAGGRWALFMYLRQV